MALKVGPWSWAVVVMWATVIGLTPLTLLGLPATIAIRTKMLLDRYPGGDITFDGTFTIADVTTALYWTFLEPAFQLLGQADPAVLSFFHIQIQDPPGWVTFPLASALWIFYTVAVLFVIGFAAAAVTFVWQLIKQLPSLRHAKLMRGDFIVLAVILAILAVLAYQMATAQ